MEGLTEGRIVHYVPSQWDALQYPNEHRPAIIVKVWRKGDGTLPDNGCSNIQVFLDGSNDVREDAVKRSTGEITLTMWKTSVLYDESSAPGTWHWIEKA